MLGILELLKLFFGDFLSSVGEFIGKNWKWLVPVVALALIILYIKHEQDTITKLTSDAIVAQNNIKHLQKEAADWKDSYNNLAKAATEQNQGIQKLNDAYQDAQKKLADATTKAAPVIKSRQAQLVDLSKTLPPVPDGENACDAAVDAAKEVLKGSVL